MNMKLKNVLYSMMAAVTFAAGSASGSTVAGNGGIFSTILSAPIEASVTAASKEVYRGAARGDNFVAAKVDTTVDLFGVALDAGLTFKDNDATDLETVFSAKATKALGDYDVSVVFNYYTEGSDVVGDQTSEVGFGVAKGVGPVDVSLTQFLALDGDNKGYGEVGVDWTPAINLVNKEWYVKGAVGYVLEEAELTHAQVTVSTDFELPWELTATPFVTAVLSLADEAGGVWADADSEVVVGVRVGRSF
tara:strand:+ start:637 stop:1380 length:744 start_codon:yes stop_codon:yes gene_type:complete